MSFWRELKRRNVYKVGVAYAIVAWLIVQATAIVFPHLNLPSWAVTFMIVILIIGFPLVLIFAWAFEITSEGIKRTKHVTDTPKVKARCLEYSVAHSNLLIRIYFLITADYFPMRVFS